MAEHRDPVAAQSYEAVRDTARTILSWLDASQVEERMVCEAAIAYGDALRRIELWPFDVMAAAESDLRAVKEHAARALRGGEA